MQGYFEWLLDDLSEVIEEFEDDSARAHQVMVILSAVDGEIPETFYRLYTDQLNIDQEFLRNALAYFSGIGEITVECDCEDCDKSLCDIHGLDANVFYDFGKNSIGKTPVWYATRNEVRSMYAELWS